MSIKKINTLLIYIFFIMFFLSNVFGSLNLLYSSTSFLIINFIILILLVLFNFDKIISDYKGFIIISLLIIIIFPSLILSENGIGSIINLLNFIIGMYIFSNLMVSKQFINLCLIFMVAIFASNVITSFDIWYNYLNGTNLVNPNGVAFCILCSTIIINFYLNVKRKRIISLLLFVISIYGILNCNSRGSLLALLFYILLFYFPFLNNFLTKHKKLIFSLLIIIGTIFPIIYVYLYINNVDFVIPFSSKPLYTGREELWFNMIENLNRSTSNFIFGLGSKYNTNIGIINNFHNWYLGVIYTFGFLGYIIYFFFLIYNIIKINNKTILCGFLSLILYGFFESGALYFTAQIFLILLIIIDKYHCKLEGVKNI